MLRFLHALAVAALSECGIEVMAGWPKYSPDLNAQENVWSWMEKAMRKEERRSDSYAVFCRRLRRVGKRFPNADTLIGSMSHRIEEVQRLRGGMTKY